MRYVGDVRYRQICLIVLIVIALERVPGSHQGTHSNGLPSNASIESQIGTLSSAQLLIRNPTQIPTHLAARCGLVLRVVSKSQSQFES